MDLLHILQILSLSITSGYIGNNIIKLEHTKNILKQIYNENLIQEETREYYARCNQILLATLNDFDKSNYPELIVPDSPFTKQEYIAILHHMNNNPELTPLINKLGKYINPKYLTRITLNLSQLQVEYPKDIFFPPYYKPLGEYDEIKNIIYIYDYNDATLSHEFLHAASTIITSNYSYIGFCIYNGTDKFFNGFNEGYTELLNERIFGADFIGYQANFIVSKLLETMFDDKQELEIAYFNNDITVFINKFLTYGSKEELIYILQMLDYFASVQFTIKEKNQLIDMIGEIISRKEEKDKILRCNQIREKDEKQNPKIIKRLVKKFN